jgi:hypothetical protein
MARFYLKRVSFSADHISEVPALATPLIKVSLDPPLSRSYPYSPYYNYRNVSSQLFIDTLNGFTFLNDISNSEYLVNFSQIPAFVKLYPPSGGPIVVLLSPRQYLYQGVIYSEYDPRFISPTSRDRVPPEYATYSWSPERTLLDVLLRLEEAGYEVHIHEHLREGPSIWVDFSLYLWPRNPEFVTDFWDDGTGVWDDGTRWEYSLNNAVDLNLIPGLVWELRPAHARLRSIYYIPGPRDSWDDGAVWSEEGDVWGPESVQIYP